MTTLNELKSEKDVPVVMSDKKGIITFVNPVFREVFRWREKKLVGEPLAILIPEPLRNAHQLGFSRFYLTGRGTLFDQSLQLKILTGDGQELEAEHYIHAEQIDGEWFLGASIRPL